MKTPGIYVEIRGDSSHLRREMQKARETVKTQATGISNAINNAISPGKVSSNINRLVANFGTLNRASDITGKTFSQIGVDLGKLTRQTGLTEREFAKFQTKLLKTQAANTQQRALRSIGSAAGLTRKEVISLGRQFGLTSAQIRKVNQQLGNTPRKFNSVNSAIVSLKGNLLAMGAGLLGAFGIGALARISDEYTNIDSKLKLVTGSSEEFTRVYERLFAISQQTGSNFATNATSFANLALAVRDAGIGTAELLQVYEDLNKSLVVSGASVNEVNSFMLQFKQAVGANRLAGDEFKAMMEANSYWAGQFAKALGTDISGLYKMKEAGLLTTKTVLDAHKKMSNSIAQDFDGLQKTIQRATTELNNAWKDVFAEGNRATGASNSIAESISNLAKTVTANKDQIIDLFTGIVKGANLAVTGIGKMVDAFKYIHNISTAQTHGMGLSQIFSMSAGELDNAVSSATGLRIALKQVKDEIAQISKVRAFELDQGEFSSWTQESENRYKALVQQRDKLQEQLTLIDEQRGVTAKLTIEAEKHKRVIEQTNEAMGASSGSSEAQKYSEKELAAFVTAAKGYTSAWEIAYRDRYEIQSRFLDNAVEAENEHLEKLDAATGKFFDEIYDNSEQTTTASVKLWEDFVGRTGEITENYIGSVLNGQFDSIGDMFKGLLDSMWDMLANFLARAASNSILEALFPGKLDPGSLTLGSLFGGFDLTGGGILEGITGGSLGKAWTGITGSIGSAASSVGSFLGLDKVAETIGITAAQSATTAANTTASLVGTQYGTFQAPASSSLLSGGMSALPFAGISLGVLGGIINNLMTNNSSVNDTLNSAGAEAAGLFSQELSEIPAALQEGSTRLRDYKYSVYDAATGTVTFAGGLDTATGKMKLHAEVLDSSTGQWVDLTSQLTLAEGELRTLSEATGILTQKQVEEVAAKYGVLGATDALIAKYSDLGSAAQGAAGDIASAIGRMHGYNQSRDNDSGDTPGFASGGYHSGGWRWVGENGPELEFTGPSRIFSNSESRKIATKDNSAVESLLRQILIALKTEGKTLSIGAEQFRTFHRRETERVITMREDQGVSGAVYI